MYCRILSVKSCSSTLIGAYHDDGSRLGTLTRIADRTDAMGIYTSTWHVHSHRTGTDYLVDYHLGSPIHNIRVTDGDHITASADDDPSIVHQIDYSLLNLVAKHH